ncbi:MAG: hypothetical protein WA919_14060 [Coleofasciculaceae cyanobacterium]
MTNFSELPLELIASAIDLLELRESSERELHRLLGEIYSLTAAPLVNQVLLQLVQSALKEATPRETLKQKLSQTIADINTIDPAEELVSVLVNRKLSNGVELEFDVTTERGFISEVALINYILSLPLPTSELE